MKFKYKHLKKLRSKSLKLISLTVLISFILLIVLLLLADIAYLIHWKISFADIFKIVISQDFIHAFLLSLLTSVFTLILVLVTAVPIGYALSRYHFFGHSIVDTFVDVPVVLPPIVLGLSLLAFFGTGFGNDIKDIVNGCCYVFHNFVNSIFSIFSFFPPVKMILDFWNKIDISIDGALGIIICQYLVSISYCIRATKTAFESVDVELEHVAMTLGCDEMSAFWKITRPLAQNGIIAGGIIAWARALGVFGPLMVFVGTGQRVQVMPTKMWLNVNIGNIEEALVISLVTMAIAAIAISLAHRILPGKGALNEHS